MSDRRQRIMAFATVESSPKCTMLTASLPPASIRSTRRLPPQLAAQIQKRLGAAVVFHKIVPAPAGTAHLHLTEPVRPVDDLVEVPSPPQA